MTITRAYCGQDGKAHVEYADHSRRTIPPEKGQAGCANLSIADSRHAFGWSVEVQNCCTSYPIATAVIVVTNGKKRVIAVDQMVWQWHFEDHGDRVAILSGPVHGSATKADLFDVNIGKKLATWRGSGNVPEWADGWQDQFH